MFDLGMSEILVIVIVAILVLGPEQMPKALYKLGKWLRQLSYTRFAVERQFENFMEREDARVEKKAAIETPVIELEEKKPDDAGK